MGGAAWAEIRLSRITWGSGAESDAPEIATVPGSSEARCTTLTRAVAYRIDWMVSTAALVILILPLPQAQGSLRSEPCVASHGRVTIGRWPRTCLSPIQPLRTSGAMTMKNSVGVSLRMFVVAVPIQPRPGS